MTISHTYFFTCLISQVSYCSNLWWCPFIKFHSLDSESQCLCCFPAKWHGSFSLQYSQINAFTGQFASFRPKQQPQQACLMVIHVPPLCQFSHQVCHLRPECMQHWACPHNMEEKGIGLVTSRACMWGFGVHFGEARRGEIHAIDIVKLQQFKSRVSGDLSSMLKSDSALLVS